MFIDYHYEFGSCLFAINLYVEIQECGAEMFVLT
jgi:hypothetical protein